MGQYVSPELQQWIREQTASGYKRTDLLKAMIDTGWRENVAAEAIDALLTPVKRRHHAAGSAASRLPERLKVPSLALDGSPLYLDAGDRQVAVLGVVKHPTIVILGDLLSHDECDALIEAARPSMARSKVLDMDNAESKVDSARTSNGTYFERGQNEVLARIEARIARLVSWPVENGEGIQVLQYGPGAEYKPHYDYFDPREPGTATILERGGGQRVATVVMYLSEPTRGGGTLFPDVGFEVGPKKGQGVFFTYDRPHPSSRSLHGGSPVVEGEKWIATKWLREGEFTRRPVD